MCGSISEMKEIKERVKDSEMVSSNLKDDPTYKEIVSLGTLNCRVLLTTSLLEEGVSFYDKDITHVIFLDSENLDTKRIQQFSARPRSVAGLNVSLFLRSERFNRNYKTGVETYEANMLGYCKELEEQLINEVGLSSYNKLFNTENMLLGNNNKVDIYNVLHNANKRFFKYASETQIINELKKDARFRLVNAYNYDKQEIEVDIRKEIKGAIENQMTILEKGVSYYVSTIAKVKKQDKLTRVVLKTPPVEVEDADVELIKKDAHYCKHDYFMREIKFLLDRGMDFDEVTRLLMTTGKKEFKQLTDTISVVNFLENEKDAQLFYKKEVLKKMRDEVEIIRQSVEFGREYINFDEITSSISPRKLSYIIRKYCKVLERKSKRVNGKVVRTIVIERFKDGSDTKY
jgi:hypothetical protein